MNRCDASLRAEIQDHLERETEDNIANGMSPADARLAALRKFGPVLRASIARITSNTARPAPEEGQP